MIASQTGQGAVAGALLLAVVAALAVNNPASAQGPATIGETTCGVWNTDKISQAPSANLGRLSAEGWVLGYLSRAAKDHDRSILRGLESERVVGAIDDYCSANPLEGLAQAAAAVEAQLIQEAKPNR